MIPDPETDRWPLRVRVAIIVSGAASLWLLIVAVACWATGRWG